jgi:zinc transporter ZupT
LTSESACSAIACFTVCAFFDGMVISSAHHLDARFSLLLWLGVVLHLLPEAVLAGVVALAGGANRLGARKSVAVVSLAFFLGGCVPLLIHGYEAPFLAISAGILMFTAFSQLLPGAMATKRGWILVVLGSLIYLGLHWLLPDVHTG